MAAQKGDLDIVKLLVMQGGAKVTLRSADRYPRDAIGWTLGIDEPYDGRTEDRAKTREWLQEHVAKHANCTTGSTSTCE